MPHCAGKSISIVVCNFKELKQVEYEGARRMKGSKGVKKGKREFKEVLLCLNRSKKGLKESKRV